MIPRFSRRGRRVRGGTILSERQNSTPGRAFICVGDVGRSGASLGVAAIPAALPPAGGGARAMAAVQHSAHGLPPAGAVAAPLRPRTLRA